MTTPEILRSIETQTAGRPPASEPEWVHLDWIQVTASDVMGLPDCFQRLQGAIELARRLNIKTWDDCYCQHWQAQRNRLWAEVVPLFDEAKTVLPLEVWSQFKHIRTPHDVEAAPDLAVAEYERLRDYALDKLAKTESRHDATRPKNQAGGKAPKPPTLSPYAIAILKALAKYNVLRQPVEIAAAPGCPGDKKCRTCLRELEQMGLTHHNGKRGGWGITAQGRESLNPPPPQTAR